MPFTISLLTHAWPLVPWPDEGMGKKLSEIAR